MSTADDGLRAGLRQLLPFLLEHRVTLAVVTGLSLLGAVATLAQPLLVGRVIGRVQAGDALGALVWLVFALVVVSSLLAGVQQYLLQRTGTALARLEAAR